MVKRSGSVVIGTFIDALGWKSVIDRIHMWAAKRESRVVCICNSHSLVTAAREREFAEVLKEADMATPDGFPVAWMLRRLGFQKQERINGPDLMWKYCIDAEKTGDRIFLYGGKPEVLESLQRRLEVVFPDLKIVGAYSPPFRALSKEEDAEVVRLINESGAGVVWVSLGCPKQERWMLEHRGRIRAVMIGVGAAFDYHAGAIKRAPQYMRDVGLEWFYRLMSEPRRLWKRYLVTNLWFLVLAIDQLIRKQNRGFG